MYSLCLHKEFLCFKIWKHLPYNMLIKNSLQYQAGEMFIHVYGPHSLAGAYPKEVIKWIKSYAYKDFYCIINHREKCSTLWDKLQLVSHIHRFRICRFNQPRIERIQSASGWIHGCRSHPTVRDLSICRFWYLWGSRNQHPTNTKGRLCSTVLQWRTCNINMWYEKKVYETTELKKKAR